MAYFTNYAGAITDGTLINSGNERQVVLREILEAIVTLAAGQTGEWKEVTGASPTPTGIQTYASTIASGVTNANSSPTTGDHVTLWQTGDPKVSSDNLARMIRIEIQPSSGLTDWTRVQIMDPFSSTAFWNGNPNYQDGDLFSITGCISSTSATGTLVNDHRLFVFGNDNSLVIALYDVITAKTQGVIGVMFPDSVTGIARGTMPYLWAWNAPPKDYTNQNSVELWSAADSLSNGQAQTVMNHAINDFGGNLIANENLEYPFSRLEGFHTNNYFAHIGQIDRVRVLNQSLIPADFHAFDSGGRSWLTLVRMDKHALCYDLGAAA